MGIGLGSGLGIIVASLCLISIQESITDFMTANEFDAKLETLKQPNSNVIKRF